jgi:hypothetical protein
MKECILVKRMVYLFLCFAVLLGCFVVFKSRPANQEISAFLDKLKNGEIEKIAVFNSHISVILPSHLRTPKEFGVILQSSKNFSICLMSLSEQKQIGQLQIKSPSLPKDIADLSNVMEHTHIIWSYAMTSDIANAAYFFEKGTDRLFAIYTSPKDEGGAFAIWYKVEDKWRVLHEYITYSNELYKFVDTTFIQKCN